MKRALITGITGQDGSYLAELLLAEGYMVDGIVRRSSTPNNQNIKHLLGHKRLNVYEGDITDASAIHRILRTTRPDEIYNLAAMSDVGTSFELPVYTAEVNSLGVMKMLEAMRDLDMLKTTRFYQASTSELYGMVKEMPQNEDTPFHPRSPYGLSKLYAYWAIKNYSESHGLWACNGILFNHESPRRGDRFVTKKITNHVSEGHRVELGNLDARRDWGHAEDYVRGMWLMMQKHEADDYVLATGETRTVRDFVDAAYKAVNKTVEWDGKGLDEVGLVDGKVMVSVNSGFYRPAEVDILMGDPMKAELELGWTRNHTFEELVADMMQ